MKTNEEWWWHYWNNKEKKTNAQDNKSIDSQKLYGKKNKSKLTGLSFLSINSKHAF